MAQITVLGYVSEDIILRTSLKGNDYVYFRVREYTRKGCGQSYQVWAWGVNAQRLKQLKVRKGNLLWLSGRLELVDSTVNHGKERTKILKVYCDQFRCPAASKESDQIAAVIGAAGSPLPSPPEELDGDRMPLPE